MKAESVSVPKALPHIEALHGYVPGLQPGEPGWVKLNTNENPYPPSPRVVQVLQAEIGREGARLRLYPNPTSAPLREVIAGVHGLSAVNVCVGNGSDDVLNLLVRCYSDRATAAAFTVPSYSLYPVLIAIQDGATTAIDLDRSMRLPVEKLAQSSARILFLTSPNAPTGVAFSVSEIEALLRAFRGLVVLDEAYAAFGENSFAGRIAEFPNLCVTRTLSKSHGLAGMRVGYALAQPAVIERLDAVRDSYNVNRLSQVAAIAALSDTEYYAEVVRKICATRERLREGLERRGWFVFPSQTNFVFAEPRDSRGTVGEAVAKSLYDHLCAQKVLVRLFPSHALTRGFVRITVGTDEEMLVLNKAIDSWTQNAPQP